MICAFIAKACTDPAVSACCRVRDQSECLLADDPDLRGMIERSCDLCGRCSRRRFDHEGSDHSLLGVS
jgi:hypothetical protein